MNACIVGCGAIASVHAEALSQLKNVALYAVCDIKKERADGFSRIYKTKAYYNFYDCIKDESIDVIHICTPHYLHFEMICKALENGKKVIAEKPVVMKKSELDILFSKYDVAKIFPIVQNRKNTCIEELKRIIDEEDVGKILGLKGILTWQRDENYYNSAAWRGTKSYEGGGVLINQAVHTLDLMMFFAGKAKKVCASMSNNSLNGIIEVEDTVDAYIEFENGAKGVFYATNAYYKNSSMQLEFEFENRSFKYIDGLLISNGEVICKDSVEFKGKSYWGNGHTKMLCDFYEMNRSMSLFDIKDTMEAMFAIYESAECRKEIVLL